MLQKMEKLIVWLYLSLVSMCKDKIILKVQKIYIILTRSH